LSRITAQLALSVKDTLAQLPLDLLPLEAVASVMQWTQGQVDLRLPPAAAEELRGLNASDRENALALITLIHVCTDLVQVKSVAGGVFFSERDAREWREDGHPGAQRGTDD
jgi:hypothetical protein